jgi:hypothetical protein
MLTWSINVSLRTGDTRSFQVVTSNNAATNVNLLLALTHLVSPVANLTWKALPLHRAWVFLAVQSFFSRNNYDDTAAPT